MFKYFTIGELVSSKTADRLKINNTLPKALLPNITGLITEVLDPLREAYGKPIIVNSGYRCELLNRVVGGAKHSDHLQGMAADITAGSIAENKKLFTLAKELNLPFKQLIDEKNYTWVHISYDKNNIRRQVLRL